MITEFAAAKINLTLEIAGLRSHGYHELCSLVAFALDIGDQLTLRPQQRLSLTTAGPQGTSIDGRNLILTVVEAMLDERPYLTTGAFHLEKRLPVASGIGGGSADAAAAVRTIARANGIAEPGSEFADVAARLGADIPVCIGGAGRTAAFMSGIGEQIWRPVGSRLLPEGLCAVLINPGVPVPTGAVFAMLNAPLTGDTELPEPPMPFSSVAECIAYVAASRNDLEAPAVQLAPEISEVLGTLRGHAGCRLARMSGSGATCFGLFDDMDIAKQAAAAITEAHADWWVHATRLG